jgi:AraC-like DNA-binding protein
MAAVSRPAFSFVREFLPAPTARFCVDRHYLLCVSRGALRLEADGTVWSLPPARAALISAGHPVDITIPTPVVSASVLVDTAFAAAPAAPLAVFDLSPLARALLDECGAWGDADEALPAYAVTMFQALVAVTWTLATRPSPARMPAGRSPELRRALALTQERLADDPRVESIAADVGVAARTLARRFEDELGMTWRAALRRLRVLRAIELLAAGDGTVTTVAMQVGYSSLSAFQAAFREVTGQTPSAYRAAGDLTRRRPSAGE